MDVKLFCGSEKFAKLFILDGVVFEMKSFFGDFIDERHYFNESSLKGVKAVWHKHAVFAPRALVPCSFLRLSIHETKARLFWDPIVRSHLCRENLETFSLGARDFTVSDRFELPSSAFHRLPARRANSDRGAVRKCRPAGRRTVLAVVPFATVERAVRTNRSVDAQPELKLVGDLRHGTVYSRGGVGRHASGRMDLPDLQKKRGVEFQRTTNAAC